MNFENLKKKALELRKKTICFDIDGVVFFTAQQFSYGSRFNLILFNQLLDNNNEIHFAR